MPTSFTFLSRVGALVLTLLTSALTGLAQSGRPASRALPEAARQYLLQHRQQLHLTEAGVQDLVLSSESRSRKSNLRHLYVQQLHQGIPIHNAVTTLSLRADGEVIALTGEFQTIPQSSSLRPTSQPSLQAAEALGVAARYLGLTPKGGLTSLAKASGPTQASQFGKAGISLEPITTRLVYQPLEDGQLRLAWEVSIYELTALNWWNIRVDALTGKVIGKDNLVTQCEFDNHGGAGTSLSQAYQPLVEPLRQPSLLFEDPTSTAYNVFAIPVESPSHGSRGYVSTGTADATASPNGWHSTAGVNYTITRGNNVHAYEDPTNNNNIPGTNYSPDGGASLLFNFPIDFTQQPVTYRDAATTNLFYMNNIMHDIWYQYGFDELSGNFQVDNYGRGGVGNDDVRAESQDSRNIRATRNNANFFTPADGSRPRMQMYLWSPRTDPELFRVTAPSSVAGTYKATEANFAAPITTVPITGKLVVANSATGIGQEGCFAYSNAAAIAGNVAVVYRGNCAFLNKVLNAQAAGAIAVVVINNVPGDPGIMSATPTEPITIPAVMVSQATGATLRAVLDAGEEVRIVLRNTITDPEVDGDFDNAIIAHEYGHGISNRLVGGPANVSCLQNAEQMGEGWSDWFGLMLTMKSGDTGAKKRGIGTYVMNQETTGQGIRPAPYSTDFGINDFTYADTNDPLISQPHGVGFVWATMLWDLTWDMVDKYGFSSDLYTGTAGNNMAMQLVIDGLKLQPCSPGFVDGREAILAADRLNFGGANQKLIWKAFAKRGLGYSASQGQRTSRFDQIEAFDLPPLYACEPPLLTVSPLTTFNGAAPKTIYLGYGQQSVTLQASGTDLVSYSWAPATGLSNTTSANPVFTPTAAGTYTFTVTVTNVNNCVETAAVTINVVDVRCGSKNNKVVVCHKGSPICISGADVVDHLNHGDNVGACVSETAGSTASYDPTTVPVQAEVSQFLASPNPASAATNLQFELTKASHYRVEVRNMQGALVAVVAEGQGEAGRTYAYPFRRNKLAAGVYMARLITDSGSRLTRVLLVE